MIRRKNLVSLAVAAAISGAAPAMAQDQTTALEEVVVTATRRSQSVQEIPYNISAISGDTIKERGIFNLTELTRGIPGLSGPDLGSRAGINNTLIMRGLNVGDAALSTVAGNRTVSPVSTYINDTPLFSNFRLVDLERVEVLRGPQGTLYGSGAVGGTLRFITRKPDTKSTYFEFTGGFSDNSESSELNYEAQAIANFPVSDNFAIRLAAAYDKRGGVVDGTNIVQTDSAGVPILADPNNVDSVAAVESRKDLDGGEVTFGKIALLWTPSDKTDVTFTYMRQDEEWDHSTAAYVGSDTSLGGGADSYQDSSKALDAVERTVDLVSLDVNHEFGFATFTSSTSYTKDNSSPNRDTSDFYETLGAYYFFFPRMLVVDETNEERKALTQEFRLVSNGDSGVDWVIGAYYHDAEFDQSGVNYMPGFGDWADDPTSSGSQIVAYYFGAYGLTTVGDFIEFGLGGIRPSTNGDLAFTSNFGDEFRDLAAFGEVTFHPSDTWQVTLGGRFFRQDLDSNLQQTIPYCGAFCSDDGADPQGITRASNSSSFSDSIFKFNTSWQFSDNDMLYLTVSEGFRRGGSNALPLAGPFVDPSFPLEYEPDTVLNKEIGIKGYLGDRRVSYTAAIYHIDWDDVQIETFTLGGFKAVTNGKSAVSKGVELELNASLTDNFLASFGYSYTDAELTDPVTLATGVLEDGDPLPFVSENQVTLSLDYNMPFMTDRELRFHIDGNYRSDFQAEPNDNLFPANQFKFDGYASVNAAVALSADTWTVQLFVRNLTNESGLSAAIVRNANLTPAAEFGRRGWLSRPRSIGLRATFDFE